MDTHPSTATEEGSWTRNRDLVTKVTFYGNTINRLSEENKTLLRQRESISKNIINAELTITFNETEREIEYIHICTRQYLLFLLLLLRKLYVAGLVVVVCCNGRPMSS